MTTPPVDLATEARSWLGNAMEIYEELESDPDQATQAAALIGIGFALLAGVERAANPPRCGTRTNSGPSAPQCELPQGHADAHRAGTKSWVGGFRA